MPRFSRHVNRCASGAVVGRQRPSRHALRGFLAAAGLAVLIADVLEDGPIGRTERAVLRRPRPAAPAWRRLSQTGETPTVLTLATTATAVGLCRRTTAWWRPVVIVAGGAAARAALCRAVRRDRPPRGWWLVTPEGASFPSRHTTWASLAVFGLLDAVPRAGSVLAAILGGAAVGGVGLSRVRLGVHWPSDVVAGALFSIAWTDTVDAVAALFGTADGSGDQEAAR